VNPVGAKFSAVGGYLHRTRWLCLEMHHNITTSFSDLAWLLLDTLSLLYYTHQLCPTRTFTS